MNAAAAAANGNGNGNSELERLRGVVADLQKQRELLLTEISQLREARDRVFRAAVEAQQEITRLKARIQELEG